VSVVAQMVNLLTEQNVSKSLLLLGPRDIYMRPELGTISAMDFGRQLEAAEIGRRTALEQADKLRALSMPPAQYAQWRSSLQKAPPSGKPVIDEIVIADTRFVNRDELRNNVSQKTGEPLTRRSSPTSWCSSTAAATCPGSTTRCSRSGEDDPEDLALREAVGAGLRALRAQRGDDFRADTAFNLRALYRKTWLNAFGGEWVVTASSARRRASRPSSTSRWTIARCSSCGPMPRRPAASPTSIRRRAARRVPHPEYRWAWTPA
jgi:NTE family protein